jgi:hypothetical protein
MGMKKIFEKKHSYYFGSGGFRSEVAPYFWIYCTVVVVLEFKQLFSCLLFFNFDTHTSRGKRENDTAYSTPWLTLTLTLSC